MDGRTRARLAALSRDDTRWFSHVRAPLGARRGVRLPSANRPRSHRDANTSTCTAPQERPRRDQARAARNSAERSALRRHRLLRGGRPGAVRSGRAAICTPPHRRVGDACNANRYVRLGPSILNTPAEVDPAWSVPWRHLERDCESACSRASAAFVAPVSLGQRLRRRDTTALRFTTRAPLLASVSDRRPHLRPAGNGGLSHPAASHLREDARSRCVLLHTDSRREGEGNE